MSDEEPAAHGDRPKKTGIELAREALAQARADAAKRQSVPGQRRKQVRQVRDPKRKRNDPQLFSSTIKQLLSDRGWEEKAAVGGVFGNWAGIVGPEVAEHTKPGAFEDGELVVNCDSPAWAQQVRLLAGQLVRRLNEELGDNTVQRVKVIGPQTPRKPGQWRVRLSTVTRPAVYGAWDLKHPRLIGPRGHICQGPHTRLDPPGRVGGCPFRASEPRDATTAPVSATFRTLTR